MNETASKSGNKTFLAVSFPVGLTVFLLIALTGTLVTFILPESYLSEARIKVPSGPIQPDHLDMGKTVTTEMEVIRTSQILQTAVQKLDLNKKWGVRYLNGEAMATPDCVKFLRSRLRLKPFQNSYIIRIGFQAPTPSEAADIANAVASAYISYRNTGAGKDEAVLLQAAAENREPYRPKVALNIVLSALVGAVAGLVIGSVSGWVTLSIHRKIATVPKQTGISLPHKSSSHRQ